MKLIAEHYKDHLHDFYYILLHLNNQETFNQYYILELLDMTEKKYFRILRKHGAYNKATIGYCFHTEEECLSAINYLEPYIIMYNLTA